MNDTCSCIWDFYTFPKEHNKNVFNRLFFYWCDPQVREYAHKKNVFLVVGTLKFYPPYTNGLVVRPLKKHLFLCVSSLMYHFFLQASLVSVTEFDVKPGFN